MPATTARIAFVSQEFRTVLRTDSGVTTKYGSLARNSGENPVETFFDDEADATAMATERFALLKGDRRLFTVEIAAALDFAGIFAFNLAAPAVTLIDDEKGVSGTYAVTAIDGSTRGTTTLKLWG